MFATNSTNFDPYLYALNWLSRGAAGLVSYIPPEYFFPEGKVFLEKRVSRRERETSDRKRAVAVYQATRLLLCIARHTKFQVQDVGTKACYYS